MSRSDSLLLLRWVGFRRNICLLHVHRFHASNSGRCIYSFFPTHCCVTEKHIGERKYIRTMSRGWSSMNALLSTRFMRLSVNARFSFLEQVYK
jgi:hypothetical protein